MPLPHVNTRAQSLQKPHLHACTHADTPSKGSDAAGGGGLCTRRKLRFQGLVALGSFAVNASLLVVVPSNGTVLITSALCFLRRGTTGGSVYDSPAVVLKWSGSPYPVNLGGTDWWIRTGCGVKETRSRQK